MCGATLTTTLTAALAAGGLAAAAYLDGKYQLRNEATAILKLKRAERAYQSLLAADRLSPWYILDETCRRQPHDRAIWSRAGGELTFGELRAQVLRWANWMVGQGIKPGDLVAMYLHNSAEFLIIFFATMVIGAGPALINYNLEGKALMHCLAVCKTKLLIVDRDEGCQGRVEGSRAEIQATGTTIVTLDASLLETVGKMPTSVPGDEWRKGVRPEFPYALIYTSGTTGLPKGCPFTISRVLLAGPQLETPFQAKRGYDCWYSPMPLYHGTGLIISSAALLSGLAVAVTPRFSVSSFWPDIHDSRSTMFIYVGETARYLLAAPPHPLERDHRLRLCYGNGMRPDVWQRFQERFNVPSVAEFFNSSEGMFALVVWARSNYLRGCVGHHGLLWRRLLHNVFIPVRFDYETGDIYRDPATGFAQRVPYEEGGEILVAVSSVKDFGGYYNNEAATLKRFATDVFKPGDIYYRAGDALRRSPDGHWYFLDRLGDTYRWKSENVSTAEVALALGEYPGIAEANVYGVLVPGYEGRAGCAAIHLDAAHEAGGLDYADLLRYAREHLPGYAVPVFLRVVKRSSHIHNHKQNKVGLRKEGVDPEKIGSEEESGREDVFLFAKPGADRYEPFGRREWDGLVGREVRL